MEITVNSKKVSVQSNLNLREYLKAEDLNDVRGIAIAVNEKVVVRDEWSKLKLRKNDKIIIIRATQGG